MAINHRQSVILKKGSCEVSLHAHQQMICHKASVSTILRKYPKQRYGAKSKQISLKLFSYNSYSDNMPGGRLFDQAKE